MSIKCKMGLHSWNGCKCTDCGKTRENQHDWSQDCDKCLKCSKTREKHHDWSKDCNVCAKCGKTREKHHDWSKDCNVCVKCGKTMEDEHDWSKDCEKCAKCGKNRENQHDWLKDCEVCSKCFYTRDNKHFWLVSNAKCTICSISKEDYITSLYDGWKYFGYEPKHFRYTGKYEKSAMKRKKIENLENEEILLSLIPHSNSLFYQKIVAEYRIDTEHNPYYDYITTNLKFSTYCPDFIKNALSKITNREALINIALTSPIQGVRCEAINYIFEPQVLIKIIEKETSLSVCCDAIKQLKLIGYENPPSLFYIPQNKETSQFPFCLDMNIVKPSKEEIKNKDKISVEELIKILPIGTKYHDFTTDTRTYNGYYDVDYITRRVFEVCRISKLEFLIKYHHVSLTYV